MRNEFEEYKKSLEDKVISHTRYEIIKYIDNFLEEVIDEYKEEFGANWWEALKQDNFHHDLCDAGFKELLVEYASIL